MGGRNELPDDATTQKGDTGYDDTDKINHLRSVRTAATLRQSL
jgi:hypothetical protein